jgi:integrase
VEQHLKLYRNHTPACEFGYTKPFFEGDATPECCCPINARGYLRNVTDAHGKNALIRHKGLGKANDPVKDWSEARRIRDQWLEWGQPTPPERNLERSNVTVAQAVEFYFAYQAELNQKSDATLGKYEIFLNKRLLPWCNANRRRMIKDFENPVVVKSFFMSWRNLQPERGKGTVLSSDVPLSTNTKLHELERFRTFIEFCRSNGWLATNFAKAPHIKLEPSKVQGKYGFSDNEWERIKATLIAWKDRYYKSNPGRKARVAAFVFAARFLGQRLSDTAMLGPHSIVEEDGDFYVKLVQIKTGSEVRIPATEELVNMLRSLPILGRTEAPFVLKRSRWMITYGTQFWFWTANVPEGAEQEQINQIIESAAKNWSDELTEVLGRTEKASGKTFEHHSTPHTFRHTFAIELIPEAGIEMVAKWLGDTIKTVEKHYWHANKGWHKKGHRLMMAALRKNKPATEAEAYRHAKNQPARSQPRPQKQPMRFSRTPGLILGA